VPKDKGRKLGASQKKGIFVCYSENSKGYIIYVVGQKEVEIIHDVTFDEDMTLKKINNLPILKKVKEADTRNQGAKEEEMMPDIDEPMDLIDPPPHEPSSSKRRTSWLRETLEDADRHIAPRGTFHESKKSNKY